MRIAEEEGFKRRNAFFDLNQAAIERLARRAEMKRRATSIAYCVVCIDPDDDVWRPLVDLLMPGHDWETLRRDHGPTLAARGVVPREFIERYIAALQEDGVLQAVPHLCAGAINDTDVLVFVMTASGVMRVQVEIKDDVVSSVDGTAR